MEKEENTKKVPSNGKTASEEISPNRARKKNERKDNSLYAQLSKKSIKAIAATVKEDNGKSISLTDDVASHLAEHVNYKITEVLHHAVASMQHSGHKKLAESDINHAFETMNIAKLFGSYPLSHKNIYEHQKGKIIDLYAAANTTTFYNIASSTASIQWISFNKATSEEGKAKTNNLTENQEKYYKLTISALQRNNKDAFSLALKDMSRNSRLQPLLPYFVHYVHQCITQHGISTHLKPLMLIDSLINNPLICVVNSAALLLEALVNSILKPLASPKEDGFDHWSTREFAAHILVKIFSDWSTPQDICMRTFSRLTVATYNTENKFSLPEWYGAVFAVIACGPMAIKVNIYKHFTEFMKRLENISDSSKKNAQQDINVSKIHGLLLTASEILLKSAADDEKINGVSFDNSQKFSVLNAKLFPSTTLTGESKEHGKTYGELYNEFYSNFGDMLMPRLSPILENERHDVKLMKLFPKTCLEKVDILSFFQPVVPSQPSALTNESRPLESESMVAEEQPQEIKAKLNLENGIKLKLLIGKKRKVVSEEGGSHKKRKDRLLQKTMEKECRGISDDTSSSNSWSALPLFNQKAPIIGRKVKKFKNPSIHNIISGRIDMLI